MKDAGSLAEHRDDLIAQHEAIEGAKFTIQEMLANDDRVAVYFILTGRVKRSGAEIERHLAAFFSIVDTKVAEGTVISARKLP